MAPTGLRKSKGDASLGPKAARVEAIFLSPDPEEGSCEASRELWRQAKAVQIGNRILPSGDRRLSAPKPIANTHATLSANISEASRGLSAKRGLPPLLLPGVEQDVDVKAPRPKTSKNIVQRVKTAAVQRSSPGGQRSANPRRYSECSSGLSSRGGSLSSGGRESTPGSSRRSSAASLETMSSPDLDGSTNSPRRKRFHFSRRYGNTLTLEDTSEEFFRLRTTATTVHSATRFRSSTERSTEGDRLERRGSRPASAGSRRSTDSHTGRHRSWSPAFHRASRKHRHRSRSASPSTALRLALPDTPGCDGLQRKNSSSDTADEPVPGVGTSSRKSSRSSIASYGSRHRRLSVMSACTPRDIQVTASRPASALSTRSRSSRPRSAAAFNAVSRPWTPSPSPSASPGSHRGYSRSRSQRANLTTATLVPPLQALNRKVRGILGCAAAILEIYTKRPAVRDTDSTSKTFPQRSSQPERKPLKLWAGLENKIFPLDPTRNKTLPSITQDPKPQRPKLTEPPVKSAPVKLTKSQAKVKVPEQVQPLNKVPTAPLHKAKRPLIDPSRTLVRSAPTTNPQKVHQMARFEPTPQSQSPDVPTVTTVPTLPRKPNISVNTGNRKKPPTTPPENSTNTQNRIKSNTYALARSSSPPNRPPSPLFVRKPGGGPPQMSTFLQKARNARGRRSEVRPQHREQFVDKDRAAAVVLGDSDIKTTLEKQTKKDRGRYVLPKESPAQVYLAQAEFELRVGGLHTALRLLDKALELQPGDKVALVTRSRCRLLLGDTTGALQDAEEALETDKTYVKAIYQKAEVLYHMGEFENALVFFHLGLKQRPDMELFQSGVRKAQEAIEISLGVKPPRAGHPGSQVPKNNNWMNKSNKAVRQVCPPLQLASKGTPENTSDVKRCAKNNKKKEDARLLGELHVDKLYLEKLLKSPSLRRVESGKSQQLVNQAQEALRFLESRQEFWRQQQPIHLPDSSSPRKKGRGGRSTSRKPRRKAVSQTPSQSTPDDLDSGYADVPHADRPNPEEPLHDRHRPLVTLVAKEGDTGSDAEPHNPYADESLLCRMQKALEEDDLPRCLQLYLEHQKLTYQSSLITGQTSPHVLQVQGKFFGNDFPLDENTGSRRLSEPSLSNDMSTSNLLTPDLGDAPTLSTSRQLSVSSLPHIEQLEAQIPHLRHSSERCHLFLELGSRYLSYGRGETAKFYGRQGLDGAQMSKDQQCCIQACLLMAAADAYCDKSDYAKERLQQAVQYLAASRIATPQPNPDYEVRTAAITPN